MRDGGDDNFEVDSSLSQWMTATMTITASTTVTTMTTVTVSEVVFLFILVEERGKMGGRFEGGHRG